MQCLSFLSFPYFLFLLSFPFCPCHCRYCPALASFLEQRILTRLAARQGKGSKKWQHSAVVSPSESRTLLNQLNVAISRNLSPHHTASLIWTQIMVFEAFTGIPNKHRSKSDPQMERWASIVVRAPHNIISRSFDTMAFLYLCLSAIHHFRHVRHCAVVQRDRWGTPWQWSSQTSKFQEGSRFWNGTNLTDSTFSGISNIP